MRVLYFRGEQRSEGILPTREAGATVEAPFGEGPTFVRGGQGGEVAPLRMTYEGDGATSRRDASQPKKRQKREARREDPVEKEDRMSKEDWQFFGSN